MANGSSRISQVDPEKLETAITNTESHIGKAGEDTSEIDFWKNQDFTMVSEAEEAESRILSPDSESVLKTAAVSDMSKNLRGSRTNDEKIGDTKESLEIRRALAQQQRQRAGAASRQGSHLRPPAGQRGAIPRMGDRERLASAPAPQQNKRQIEGEKTAAGVRKIPPSSRQQAAPKKPEPVMTAAGVKKITPPPRSNKAPSGNSETMTAIGVRRIPQSEESKREAYRNRVLEHKKERGAKIRKIVINIVCWILVLGLCGGAFYLGYRLFNDVPVDVDDISRVTVAITGFENDDEMADFLEENDFIRDKFLYKIRCLIYDADYKEGTYKISRSFTTEKIINILSGFKAYSDGTLDED